MPSLQEVPSAPRLHGDGGARDRPRPLSSGWADVGLMLRRRSFSPSSFSIWFAHSRVLSFFFSICSFLIAFLSHELLVRSSICSLHQLTGQWRSGDPLPSKLQVEPAGGTFRRTFKWNLQVEPSATLCLQTIRPSNPVKFENNQMNEQS